MIRGIIFDCDGTLFDSETPSFIAWKELFVQYDVKFPFKKWTKCLGSSPHNFDAYSYLQKKVQLKISEEELLKKRLDRKKELTSLQRLRRGVKSYLVEARKNHLKLAVVSSSSKEWVFEHLIRLNILKVFDVIVCSEDVKFIKPHPELYLKAVAQLFLKPDEAIAIEDSPNGVSSAKAAGIFCLAVTNNVTKLLDFKHADLKINSFTEIGLNELLIKVKEFKGK